MRTILWIAAAIAHFCIAADLWAQVVVGDPTVGLERIEAKTVVERMTTAGRGDDVVHLSYPDAGHLIFWDYLPATAAERNQGQIFGGTTPATAAARAGS